MLLVLATLR